MPNEISKASLWTGRVISLLVILFMLFDATIHIMKTPTVVQAFTQMGYSLSVVTPLSIVEFLAILLYIFPRTSGFGAILLTGYLGGAVDANVRAGNTLFGFVLFPVYVGILLWLGLYLRYKNLRDVVPFLSRQNN